MRAPKQAGEIIDERQRRLTEEQKERLVRILSPHKDQGPRPVRIRYRRDDSEAFQFAHDFEDVFRIVGWSFGRQPFDYPMEYPDGLSIAVNWNQIPHPSAQILADALKQIGLTVKIVNTREGLREDEIAFIIGRNF